MGGRVMMSSIRVTDDDTSRVVKDEARFVRFEIDRRLVRSLRLHGGLVKGIESLFGNVVRNVVSLVTSSAKGGWVG